LQSYANCNGDSDGCCFSNSDLYSDSDGDGCCFSDSDLYSDGNRNGDGDAHAAAYPNAETGPDSGRAYGQLLFL
jgi:hypothetical protein